MKAAALVCVVLFGCGGRSDDGAEEAAEPRECKKRSGTFSFVYEERTGNCGATAEVVATVDQGDSLPSGCSGRNEASKDNCVVTTIDLACPAPGVGPGYTSLTNGKYEWSIDGQDASGVMSISVFDADGQALCQGTYDVVVVRL